METCERQVSHYLYCALSREQLKTITITDPSTDYSRAKNDEQFQKISLLMTKSSLSIVMRSCNDRDRIGAAIESILSQSYSDFELLILDDSSTDGTPEVIRAFADSRIRLIIHDQDRGKAATLNEGVELCTRPLIVRMDPCNISHPWRLEKLVAYMENHPGCMAAGSWIKWMDADGKYLRVEGAADEALYFHFIFKPCLRDFSMLYRKQAILSVGGYCYADQEDLIWRIMLRFRVHVLEEPLQGAMLSGDPAVSGAGSLAESVAGAGFPAPLDGFLRERDTLSDEARYCLSNHFWPSAGRPRLKEVYQTLTMLETITARITTLENPNRSADTIRSLAREKQRHIIRNVATQLPFTKMWQLVTHFNQPTLGLKQTLVRMRLNPRKPYYY